MENKKIINKKKGKIMKKKIAIACDVGGLVLKNFILSSYLKDEIEFLNLGTDSNDAVDYPDYAKKVATAIVEKKVEMGILICGTGIGMSITANKFKGIRAALCHNSLEAKLTREHNDANIICLGARIIGEEVALDNIKTFLETPFSNAERHCRRVNKIES